MYDLIIVGGGPAGVAAGVYAARKKIKSALVTDSFGGQSLVSADVQNWIGTISVSGFDLGQMLEKHLRAQEDIDIIDSGKVTKVDRKDGGGFVVTTEKGKTLEAKYLLIASGSRRRKLKVPGEAKFEGRGVVYCSICDAPLFKDKTVAIVGGGNAGLEAVIDSLPYAKKIYLLQRDEKLKGDPITEEKIKKEEKVTVIVNAETTEIVGGEFVSGLKYKDRVSGEMKELALDGVFVEIGILPNSEFMKGVVELNKFGEMVIDHKTQRSSDPGIWGAGDVTDVLYKQNNISAGDAVKAVLNIYDKLNKEG